MDTFRSTRGLAFANYDYGGFSFEEAVDGRADVLVHDSNVPFEGGELSNGFLHQDRELRQSVIRIDRSSWELDMGAKTWRGGNNTLFAFGREVIGENPTLPDLTGLRNTLSAVLFGSADGAVRSAVEDGDFLPSLDAAATPGAGGVVAGTSHTVRGVKAGRYRQAVLRKGTLASVEAPTAEGVEDSVRAVPGGLAFKGEGPARAVTLDVVGRGGLGDRHDQDLRRRARAWTASGSSTPTTARRRRSRSSCARPSRAPRRRSSPGRCASPPATP